MLKIICKYREPENHPHDGYEFEWHIGDIHKPFDFSNDAINDSIHEVIEVQASGDELQHIRHKLYNIRDNNDQPLIRWFGDEAKFIAANL